MKNYLLHEVALLLSKALPLESQAQLLNELLSIEADPKYTDREVRIGQCLFDTLSQNDAAVKLAMESAVELSAAEWKKRG
jgi:hypothetical protein